MRLIMGMRLTRYSTKSYAIIELSKTRCTDELINQIKSIVRYTLGNTSITGVYIFNW
jgi:hypothetical protein